MVTFFIGLIIGMFIGAGIGVFSLSLCVVAKDKNENKEDK